jgi:quinol monooxygenase YgiN
MIHVIATVELVAGSQENFLREFQLVRPKVLAEAGCLEYGAAVDLPTGLEAQTAPRPDVVTIVEKWADLDALRAHLTAPHMLEYRPRVKEFVRSVRLTVLKPVQAAEVRPAASAG